MKIRQWLKMLRPPRRPAEQKHVPYIEFYVGRLSGAALTWLASRALKRGDIHEFNHCSAVLAVGNTDGDHTNCPLDFDFPLKPAHALQTVVKNYDTWKDTP